MLLMVLRVAAESVETVNIQKANRLTSPTSAVSGSLSCDDQRLFLSIQIKKNQSVVDALSEVARSENQLLIFGESHIHSAGIARYPEFIEVIRSSRGVDCIFIEGKGNFQGAINDYFEGKPYEDTVGRINTQRPGSTPLAQASKSLLEYAKSKGLKVFAVDTVSSSQFVRDAHMANKISQLMQDQCSKPVLLVGKTHIYERLIPSHPKAAESAPIPDRLRSKGISVSSVNMISRSELHRSYNGYSNRCPNPLTIPDSDFGFIIRAPAPAIEKAPMNHFEPEKWTDYQAAIVVN